MQDDPPEDELDESQSESSDVGDAVDISGIEIEVGNTDSGDSNDTPEEDRCLEIGWQRDTYNSDEKLTAHMEGEKPAKKKNLALRTRDALKLEFFVDINERLRKDNERLKDMVTRLQSREQELSADLSNRNNSKAKTDTRTTDTSLLETAKADRENLNKRWFLFWAGSMLLLMTVCIWIVMNSIPPLDQ